MRALQFADHGEPKDVLKLQEATVPTVGAGQARVRMLLSPINPSDLLKVRGLYGKMPSYPAVPGFEGIGIVEEVNSLVAKLAMGIKPGRKVVVLNQNSGNWQEQVVVPALRLFPVPDGVSDHDAAGYFVNPATALVMTTRELQVAQGAWLLQSAAGSSLGKMVVKLGKKLGFKTINLVRRPETAEILKKLGADVVIDTSKEDVVERVKTITNGEMVKYALDAVGGATASQMVKCLGMQGKLLVYGSLDWSASEFTNRQLIGFGSKVEGFALQQWSAKQSKLQMLSLLKQIGKLMQEKVLTTDVAEVFPFEKYQDAIQAAETPGRQGKILLQFAKE
jgi:NADPH:quinone reductase-like Zn-dependent oxidoreductase